MSAFKQMQIYPQTAGFKRPGTSSAAAAKIAPVVTGLRARVLRSLKEDGPATPDETAERLNVSILSIRPRFSELNRFGLIEMTGERRTNHSGVKAEVWRSK